MRTPVYLTPLLFAGIFLTAAPGARSSNPFRQKARQTDSLLGNWTGTSLCQVKNSPCHDENVVFHFLPGIGPDKYKVSADKIVDGKLVNMGELDFTFNRATNTLTCVFSNGTWVLVVNKTHMDGTLTTTDKVLYRKLSLSRRGS